MKFCRRLGGKLRSSVLIIKRNIAFVVYFIAMLYISNSLSMVPRIFRKGNALASSSTRQMNNYLSERGIDNLVKQRAEYRLLQQYDQADAIKNMLMNNGVAIVDKPLRDGGSSTWSFAPSYLHFSTIIDSDRSSSSLHVEDDSAQSLKECTSVMNIAQNCALLLSKGIFTDNDIAARVIELLRMQFRMSTVVATMQRNQSREMQGRKFADAALEFSLAGLKNDTVYKMLAAGAESELQRTGHRQSCRVVDVLTVLERLATAGLRNHSAYTTAGEILLLKQHLQRVSQQQPLKVSDSSVKPMLLPEDPTAGDPLSETLNISAASLTNLSSIRGSPLLDITKVNETMSLFSSRVLMTLWRQGAKGEKSGLQKERINTTGNNEIKLNSIEEDERVRLLSAAKYNEDSIASLFSDPTLPLVVDLGCGFGVTLLQMSENTQRGLYRRACNFLGVDMSSTRIAYARGLAARWGVESFCRFVCMESSDCLRLLRTQYTQGQVALVTVNFPTPYHLSALLSVDENLSNTKKTIHENSTEASLFMNLSSLPCGVLTPGIDQTEKIKENTKENGRNHQLPVGMSEFMVQQSLLTAVVELFSAQEIRQKLTMNNTNASIDNRQTGTANITSGSCRHSHSIHTDGPFMDNKSLIDFAKSVFPSVLYVQSNVEDVALTIHHMVTEVNHKRFVQFNEKNTAMNDTDMTNSDLTTSSSTATKNHFVITTSTCENMNTMSTTNVTDTIFEVPKAARIDATHIGEISATSDASNRNSRFHVLSPTELEASINALLLPVVPNAITWRSKLELEAYSLPQRQHMILNKFPQKEFLKNDLDGNYSEHHDHSMASSLPNYLHQRASGRGWLSHSPLPHGVQTETEAQCQIDHKAVHRMLYVYRPLPTQQISQ